jgi:hypothetical protein
MKLLRRPPPAHWNSAVSEITTALPIVTAEIKRIDFPTVVIRGFAVMPRLQQAHRNLKFISMQ